MISLSPENRAFFFGSIAPLFSQFFSRAGSEEAVWFDWNPPVVKSWRVTQRGSHLFSLPRLPRTVKMLLWLLKSPK